MQVGRVGKSGRFGLEGSKFQNSHSLSVVDQQGRYRAAKATWDLN